MYKTIATLIFCVALAPTILAQSGDQEISGAGTPNYLAKFTGKNSVGNSSIVESYLSA